MTSPVVIVTGGGRGIGRAICDRFAAGGFQVVAASRSEFELRETAGLIETRGQKVRIVPTDLCVPDEIDALFQEAVGAFGRVDTLVNCAGVAPKCAIEELDGSLFRALMSVNVDAVFHACRAAWPIMKKQGGGVILNISSIASQDPFPGFAAYGASKAWVNAWTRGLAEEGRSVGIRVYAVAPGAVETRMLRDPFPDFPPDQTLQPRDVAEQVFALTQPASHFATGQTLFIRR